MTKIKKVILVDSNNNEIGTEEKLKAHISGSLHRAFSIFIFNNKGELLLQKRNSNKYHSGGLWTNTCCSHPSPGEDTLTAAHKRLVEEMGFDCELKEIFNFTYKAKLDKNLIEHEFDHVFIGHSNQIPMPNTNEVEDWVWQDLEEVALSIRRNSEQYTHWFKIAISKISAFYLLGLKAA